jgi:peptidoglycan hydrolase-like protein with peptidoglycan-binding domain
VVIRLGDTGPAVSSLQRGLNKLGAMLLVDGDFGGATKNAVLAAQQSLGVTSEPGEASEALQTLLEMLADPFPPLTAAGVTFIGRAEVTSADLYERKYKVPHWPSPASGITIGIGYDLQFATRTQFREEWQDCLPQSTIDRLARFTGFVGSAAILASVADLVVPLFAAAAVFTQRTLPRYFRQTQSIYPTLDALPAAQRTALTSLVYNRGTRLEDRDPVRQERREMRAIRDLLARGQLDAVDEQFESMTRLWANSGLAGLGQRRRDEATLWRSGFAALKLD